MGVHLHEKGALGRGQSFIAERFGSWIADRELLSGKHWRGLGPAEYGRLLKPTKNDDAKRESRDSRGRFRDDETSRSESGNCQTAKECKWVSIFSLSSNWRAARSTFVLRDDNSRQIAGINLACYATAGRYRLQLAAVKFYSGAFASTPPRDKNIKSEPPHASNFYVP